MHRVVQVEAKPGYVLELEFDDGLKGSVCVKDELYGPMFEPLKDPAFFEQVFVDEFGAVSWPNQADLAPDALYSDISERKGFPA